MITKGYIMNVCYSSYAEIFEKKCLDHVPCLRIAGHLLMHFSKTYSQLLRTLPDELRNNAIEYRQASTNASPSRKNYSIDTLSQLKKLINQLVEELDALGLSPLILHELLQPEPSSGLGKTSDTDSSSQGMNKGKQRAWGERPSEVDTVTQSLLAVSLPPPVDHSRASSPVKAFYELAKEGASGDIVPQLRFLANNSTESMTSSSPRGGIEDVDDSDDVAESSLPSRAGWQTAPHTATPSESDGAPEVMVSGEHQRQKKHAPEDEVIMSSRAGPYRRQNLLWSLQERTARNYWSSVADTDAVTHHDEEGFST